MLRYYVFEYSDEPKGGMEDCVASFENLEKAVEWTKKRKHDFHTNKVIWDMVKDTEAWGN